MIDVKEVAKKITLDEFNKRFTPAHLGVTDNLTGKNYYCPHDLGFNFTLDDCASSSCTGCWKEAESSLKLRESKVVNIEELRKERR